MNKILTFALFIIFLSGSIVAQAQAKGMQMACPTYTFPCSENFEGYPDDEVNEDGIISDFVHQCWVHMDQSADYPAISSLQAFSGTHSLYFNSYTEENLEVMHIQGSYNMRDVTLHVAVYAPAVGDFIIIGVVSDASNLHTYVPIDTLVPQYSNHWERFSVNFSSYTGNGKYLAFHSVGNNEIYIDDIAVDYFPCELMMPTYENYENFPLGQNECWTNAANNALPVIDYDPLDTTMTFNYNYTYRYDSTYANASGSLDFSYTGGMQSYTLGPGTYTVKAWGGQGGDGYYSGYTGAGGKGGYAQGTYTINTTTTVYIYVGGQGTTGSSSGTYSGGYNGGGSGYYYSGGGGGATHVSTRSGLLQNQSSYVNQLLLVAGGGGGGHAYSSYTAQGGYGGGTSGGYGATSGYWTSTSSYRGYPGTQSGGGYNSTGWNGSGSFGTGGNYYSTYCAGGGAGYYGGACGGYNGVGGGGGCGYVSPTLLTSAYTTAGNLSFPSTTGSTETGHSGAGFVKILYDSTYLANIDTVVTHFSVDTFIHYHTHSLLIAPGVYPSYVVSPKIEASDFNITGLTFQVFSPVEETIEIGVMSDPNDISTFTSFDDVITHSGMWKYVYARHCPQNISGQYLAFKSSGARKVYIDNLDFSISVDVKDNPAPTYSVQVIPNPTHDYLTLKCSDESKVFQKVEIYNMYGKLIKSYPATSNTFSVSDLANGVYILRADNAVTKFVKQ